MEIAISMIEKSKNAFICKPKETRIQRLVTIGKSVVNDDITGDGMGRHDAMAWEYSDLCAK